MFFWNSPSNSIIVPNVMLYWSNDDSFTQFSITTNSPNRTSDGQRRLIISGIRNDKQFQYLRIVMSFNDESEWIFLSEMQFCGE